MHLSKPTMILLDGLDGATYGGLRDLCIGHDMLRTESYVPPLFKTLLGPLYRAVRWLSRTLGVGPADATSMHPHYASPHFLRLSAAAQQAAERELNCDLSLVTALTHKARRGESSSWHNGYYSPYIYDDDADVYSVWIPLQSISPNTGSAFRFWYGGEIEAEAKALCRNRWKEIDARPRATPADIISPGRELRALYKMAEESDKDADHDRCTCHARLGEAIVFNEYWPHKTTNWVGEGVRLSVVLRFVRKGTILNGARLKRRKQALRLDDAEWAEYCTHISKLNIDAAAL